MAKQHETDDEYISISTMAKLHKISRQTLLLYDRIDLFKPVYVNEKGYRYYSVKQIPFLREICFLKNVGMPLETIKGHMENPTTKYLHDLLVEQKEELDEQIEELQKKRNWISQRADVIQRTAVGLKNVNIPYVEQVPDRKFVFSPYKFDVGMTKPKLHLALMRAWREVFDAGQLPSKGFGSLLKLDAIKSDNPLQGAGCIIQVPFDCEISGDESVIVIPGGMFLTMYKYGMPYDTRQAEALIDWGEKKGYKLVGDVVDLCLIDTAYYSESDEADFCRLQIKLG